MSGDDMSGDTRDDKSDDMNYVDAQDLVKFIGYMLIQRKVKRAITVTRLADANRWVDSIRKFDKVGIEDAKELLLELGLAEDKVDMSIAYLLTKHDFPPRIIMPNWVQIKL